MKIMLSWTYPLHGYSLTKELMKTNEISLFSIFLRATVGFESLLHIEAGVQHTSNWSKVSMCCLTTCNQPKLDHRSRKRIWGLGLFCALTSRSVDDISIPLVLCIEGDLSIIRSQYISFLISRVQSFFDVLSYNTVMSKSGSSVSSDTSNVTSSMNSTYQVQVLILFFVLGDDGSWQSQETFILQRKGSGITMSWW